MENKELATTEQNTGMAILQQNITDSILSDVKHLEQDNNLFLPKDYSCANALKSAWLTLQTVETKDGNKALEFCTKESITNSLLDMVIQGLSPGKKQCYFIPFGKNLTLLRSYFGSVSVAKRVAGLVDIMAEVVREEQEFTFEVQPETGIKILKEHKMPLDTLNNTIIGAYAVKALTGGKMKMDVMTREDIQKAWEQGSMRGKSGAHLNFESEMCKKTVINRSCKIEINSSSDSDIIIAAVNRTTGAEYENQAVEAEYKVEDETKELQEKIISKKTTVEDKSTKKAPPYTKLKKAIKDGKVDESAKSLMTFDWSDYPGQLAELQQLIADSKPKDEKKPEPEEVETNEEAQSGSEKALAAEADRDEQIEFLKQLATNKGVALDVFTKGYDYKKLMEMDKDVFETLYASLVI